MIDSLLFQNAKWFWPVVCCAIMLWLLFAWKEWKKPITKYFYINILIAGITISSLAMLALKPMLKSDHQNQGVLFLTKGFDKDRLDSLKRVHKNIKLLSYKKNLEIGTVLDSTGTVYVLGEGVASYDFWQFKNRSVVYLGSNMPNGIVDLTYSSNNVLGENLILKGRYHNARHNSRLVLEDGTGLGVDSIQLDKSNLQEFELTTSLKAKGKFVFKLVEKDSLGKLISEDPVYFQVTANKTFKVLLVNGFPTFETKYLKNFLAEMGHEVVVKSQITKGRYKFEYFNTQKSPIYSLSEKELEYFDLLVIDANSLKNSSKRAKSSIENSIKNKGMGVFIQPASSSFQQSSEKLKFQFNSDGISKVRLTEFPELSIEKSPFKFKETNGLEKIYSSKGGLITAYKRFQKGRVGSTLLQNTYQLQLNGKTEIYRQLWATIVNTLAKKEKLTTEWEPLNLFPLENHPFKFMLRTVLENPKVRTGNGKLIAMQQDFDLPSLWNGITYPKKQGWNSLDIANDSLASFNYYVTDSLVWQSVRSHTQQKENKRYFTAVPQKAKPSTSFKSIELFWFFLIVLVGLGYLWLYPKLFQS